MIFLNDLRATGIFHSYYTVTGISYSFRLVLDGNAGKEIPESWVTKMNLGKNFVLSDVKGNTSEPLNRGGIADLTLLRTLLFDKS